MTELTRRGFLSLFGAAAVVAVLPSGAALGPVIEPATCPIDPWAITAPDGWTYQWVRTAVMGVADPENVAKRIDNGWRFVAPEAHPGAPVATVERAIAMLGLILMERPTVEVEKQRAAEHAAAARSWPGFLRGSRAATET